MTIFIALSTLAPGALVVEVAGAQRGLEKGEKTEAASRHVPTEPHWEMKLP